MAKRTAIDESLCRQIELLLKGGATGTEAARLTGTSQGTVSRIKAAGYDLTTFMEMKNARRNPQEKAEAKEEKKAEEQVPGQIRMELPGEMSEQTKMMRFQAGQIERLYGMLSRINDNLSQILRRLDHNGA